ncbi:MAG: SDR family oxidoreductase, partial [Flavobacteriaceae bacterium]|nr:SDR family oxidoreductase [Flavobacteriaceae bacterium]
MENNETEIKSAITSEEIDRCIAVLAQLVEETEQIFDIPKDQRTELLKVTGMFSRPDRDEFSRRKKDGKKVAKRKLEAKNKTARKETGIRSAREAVVFVAPKLLPMSHLTGKIKLELETPRKCYVCKTEFTKMHHFYDSMCTTCGDFNYAKRFQTANVKGQVAVITGSRLKIGYHISLMLLRGGATVIATTRFPVDSALRFSKEEDFTEWGHRLKIHGLDLRHIPSVEIFCNFIGQKYERLDILINNAAQTVRRPAGFY